jgi:Aminoglycoside-2''-adenylyltransferase
MPARPWRRSGPQQRDPQPAPCSCISFQSRTGWHDVLVDSWQVLAVMDLLAAEGAIGWIDGGWGVDALLGEQTR